MIEEIISIAVKLIVAVIAFAVTTYIVPYLKDRKIYSKIKEGVQAAEKLALSGQIHKAEKKEYVLDFLAKCGIKITPTIDSLIESAVLELDVIIDKTKKA